MTEIHIVIGPTSSGKSDYAVRLAKKVNGEIISADSRQVYKGFALASGQVPGKWQQVNNLDPSLPSPILGRDKGRGWQTSSLNLSSEDKTKSFPLNAISLQGKRVKVKGSPPKAGPPLAEKVKSNSFVYKGVPHYCIDFVSPKRVYTVADFVKDGQKALKNILLRGKTPIICGGTGHYIDALLFGQNLPDVPPDKKFREQMEKISAEQLFAKLQKLDPARAKTIDPHNKRRLIRALEIIHHTGKPVPEISSKYKVVKLAPPLALVYPAIGVGLPRHGVGSKLKNKDKLPSETFELTTYNSFESEPESSSLRVEDLQPIFHYLNPPAEELYPKIEKRLKQRVKQGMLEELWLAHQKGVSWKRLEDMGLEFKHVSRFLRENSKQKTVSSKVYLAKRVGNSQHSNSNNNSNHSDKLRKLGLYSSNSYHSDKISKLGLYFLKSSHFQDLLSDIKKYTKRQRTWFKKYTSILP